MNDSIDDLKNYKFICFNGEPKYILIDDDKKYTKKNGNLYDLNLNLLPYKFNSTYPAFPPHQKPKSLKKMIKLASILSKSFPYIRVDFHLIKGKIFFDKIDFTSSNGIEDIPNKLFKKKLFSLIKLPKFIYNIDAGEYYEIRKKKYSLNPFIMVLFFLTTKIYSNKKIFFNKIFYKINII